ncbi:GNAT family N-acetyltransferase [Metabacillus niabensis]|uniref:Ribosomal protein S18 acetylase RimI-like enzyme n=1 Tax=Metabacillus niabensis TaxID=324854 RepID=A0ABT9YX09_9BACI|nr:GNAT family N-acetyltransferase [Metabacillus niabensis]MDQ0223848.1 ribosomal protein S18 acetylase RimI-like enzyme [Metabacillus niabensis]
MESNVQLTYKLNVPLDPKDVANVFKESGIKRPADDLPRIKQMIDNADLTFSAWDQNKLVGIARAITDYCYCCYLSDLAIDKAYQHKGIGKHLVELLQEELGETVALILLSSPIAMDYYPHIGFEKIDNGFRIARKN